MSDQKSPTKPQVASPASSSSTDSNNNGSPQAITKQVFGSNWKCGQLRTLILLAALLLVGMNVVGEFGKLTQLLPQVELTTSTSLVLNGTTSGASASASGSMIMSWFGSNSNSGSETTETSKDAKASETASTITQQLEFDPQQHASRKAQAQAMLDHMMQKRNAFNGPMKVYNRDHVLKNGFQRAFPPCSMERIFQRKIWEKSQNNNNSSGLLPLEIVVLGGSSSSRAATGPECQIPGNRKGGRYSDQLEHRFQQDALATWNSTTANTTTTIWQQLQHMDLVVQNRAQGGSDSVNAGVLMDELVNHETTDIISWEYLINDHRGSGLERARKLDFFFKSIKMTYDLHNKLPPPIILNYLWTYAAGGGKHMRRSKRLDEREMEQESGKVVDEYRKLGWEIAVNNVGKAIDFPAVRKFVQGIFDDMHHPSCGGVALISDMMEYAILNNLAQDCPASQFPPQYTKHNQTGTILPPHMTYRADIKEEMDELWRDLFNDEPGTRMGSITPWEPRVVNHTNLRIKEFPFVDWETAVLAKATSSRADRKQGYAVPSCQLKGPKKSITIQEPDLKWLMLSYKGDEKTKFWINGRSIRPNKSRSWNPAILYIDRFINFRQANIPYADEYVVEFCFDEKKKTGWLEQLVGVVIPDPTGQRQKTREAATATAAAPTNTSTAASRRR